VTADPAKLAAFSKPARRWFLENFAEPTPVQTQGWNQIAEGSHSLLVAPTGSGKTLAAFFWAIDRCSRTQTAEVPGTKILYISPLKALAVDVERNLRAPLVGILRTAEQLGEAAVALRIDVRTGDTPAAERRQQARDPADILVTTPESLYLLLGSQARAGLASVTTVIIDEIHSLAPTKRGTHLALSLERLHDICPSEPQRIGLSATVKPLDEVARFLAGTRPYAIVDAHEKPKLDLEICVPVPDMDRPPAPPPRKPKTGGNILGQVHSFHSGEDAQEKGVWPAIYPEVVKAIQEHHSTILFVNSRGLSERLTHRLNEIAGEELVRSHHGSVSHAKRAEIENALKRGELRAIVATSSLELGIDMGAVDLVILLESPGSVARGLQRVGRAGHHVGLPSRGRIFPKFKGDLLECVAVSEGMMAGAIESLSVPENPLDVLAQQLVSMCVDKTRTTDELKTLVQRAHSFRALPETALRATLDMLTGRFPSSDFADLRPRLNWDRSTDQISARRGSAMVTRMNAGTIPDRGAFPVHIVEGGPRIGELDEEMVHESRPGETIVLGASTWRIQEITRDRVLVSPAPGETGRLPFWKGEKPGRPLELGHAMGRLLREVGPLSVEEAKIELQRRAPLTDLATKNLIGYLQEQKAHSGALPTDRTLVVERFRDELGDWRVCLLSPFGNRVHAPWALAIEELLGERSGFDVQVLYHDDGIALRFADTDEIPPIDELIPDPDEVDDLVTRRLGSSALFASLFRENAVRSLLITRRRPGQRSPLWAQRLKARGLLATAERFPDFPIVLETYRQALSDVFDLPALKDLLTKIRSRELVVREVETASPSPFARSLAFAYVASFLYNEDAPVAERRAQALTLDRGLLRELLGQAELRELLDEGAIETVEAELTALADDRRARDGDEVDDLLRRLGDLTEGELFARTILADSDGESRNGSDRAPETAPQFENDPRPQSIVPAGFETLTAWLTTLQEQRRACRLRIAGAERWIRADESAIYRDALGTVPAAGLPVEFLASGQGLAGGETPLEFLVRRFARTRGPFSSDQLAQRYGLRAGMVEPILADLERRNELVRGEIRPSGTELEWCHVEVLRRIKRRTLAILRGQIAAVDRSALARFLPSWQGVRTAISSGASPKTLPDVLEQLEGLPLPYSALISDILPARVHGFVPTDLDALGASGRIVWIGCGSLGTRDGRISIFRRENFASLHTPTESPVPGEPIHRTVLELLEARGASFQLEIEMTLQAQFDGMSNEEIQTAIWDLAWEGHITNDTFGPLQDFAGRRAAASRGRPRRPNFRRQNVPVGGRWWRTDELLRSVPNETVRTLHRAESLLARYGVVSREVARSEKLAGGFAPLYRVLSEMEDSGKVRRGWFVEGLSGGQFALLGALDRLRQAEPDIDSVSSAGPGDVLVLSAVDPANPYGSLLPWPETETTGSTETETSSPARRTAGAHVILVRGRLRIYVPKSRKEIWTFGRAEAITEIQVALARLVDLPTSHNGGRSISVERIDGEAVTASPIRTLLEEVGFVRGYRAYTL